MSLNWVMLDSQKGFVPLPGERIMHKSTPRLALAITTPATYPGNNPLAIHCNSGTAYITNQRIIYLPDTATPELKSFSAPLLNIHDSCVSMPWFGPNAWQAVLQPVPGGNIPAAHANIELKLTFKEGGAPDFHSTFERIKERLQQVVSTAREENLTAGRQDSVLDNVNLDTVHLDQLPSYQESGGDRVAPWRGADPPDLLESSGGSSQNTASQTGPSESQPPPDAPPGYEETQQQSIQAELERRLSQSQR
ncbi:hypothetical protein LTS15_010071 [Exophiala xenobiotica]|nr:hypothetical protein LTS15_010071 [Exophiala xenobiotica]